MQEVQIGLYEYIQFFTLFAIQAFKYTKQGDPGQG